jgi:hypothetical protein
VKVFFLFPLFSKEGLGEIGSIKNNNKVSITYGTKIPLCPLALLSPFYKGGS